MKILADLDLLGLHVQPDLGKMLDEASALHGGSTAARDAASGFLWERNDYLHERRGSRPDEIRAVRTDDWSLYRVIKQRLEAYKKVRHSDNFRSLAALFKRVKNISNGVADDGRGLPELRSSLTDEAELALVDAMMSRWPTIEPPVADAKYGEVVEALAELQPYVDRFFKDVLVMTDESGLREARLMVLVRLRRAVLDSIGDMSELVPEDGKAQSLEPRA